MFPHTTILTNFAILFIIAQFFTQRPLPSPYKLKMMAEVPFEAIDTKQRSKNNHLILTCNGVFITCAQRPFKSKNESFRYLSSVAMSSVIKKSLFNGTQDVTRHRQPEHHFHSNTHNMPTPT
jgi:hypothetical protein